MEKKIGNIFKGDKVIWMVFFFLCIISIIEVFSSSSTLSYKSENYWAPIIKHGGTIIFGFVMAVAMLNTDCRYFKLATLPLLGLSFILLLYVLVAGGSTNDAARWINFLGIQFQPSEMAKMALVFAAAQILSALQTPTGADKDTMKFILSTSSIFILLIALENMSTAVLICIVLVLMMFVGNVSIRQIGKLIGRVMLVVGVFVAAVMIFGNDKEELNEKQNLTEQYQKVDADKTETSDKGFVAKVFHRFGTWKGRIKRFFNNVEVPPEKYDLADNLQVGHANIAIASSNIVGVGPGNSVERDFLPQAFSDFIYAIIIEEMGIWGAALVAFLYIVLFFRTGRIASRCQNYFPAFLIMGLAMLMVIQALFNMMVAVGLAPVTGQPLPLISKGGSATVFSSIYIGVILSVSRSAKRKVSSVHNESLNTGKEASKKYAE